MTYITATEIRPGDSLEIPGWMLHEDLSGLRGEIRVTAVEYEGDWVVAYHGGADRQQRTCFKVGESVQLNGRRHD